MNAVSLYVERGRDTFHSVHVESAQRLAIQAHRAGVQQLVHVSGIGADASSPSLYIRKRGEGELAVLAAFADATLLRPAVMFGPDDSFLTAMLDLLRRLPIYPMFGRGRTRLQPAYVEDVAVYCSAYAASRNALNDIRVRRSPYLLLRGTPQNHCTRGGAETQPHPGYIYPVVRTGLVRRNSAESARHSEPSGADAGRQHIITSHPRI
jgi:hypothetical protein